MAVTATYMLDDSIYYFKSSACTLLYSLKLTIASCCRVVNGSISPPLSSLCPLAYPMLNLVPCWVLPEVGRRNLTLLPYRPNYNVELLLCRSNAMLDFPMKECLALAHSLRTRGNLEVLTRLINPRRLWTLVELLQPSARGITPHESDRLILLQTLKFEDYLKCWPMAMYFFWFLWMKQVYGIWSKILLGFLSTC